MLINVITTLTYKLLPLKDTVACAEEAAKQSGFTFDTGDILYILVSIGIIIVMGRQIKSQKALINRQLESQQKIEKQKVFQVVLERLEETRQDRAEIRTYLKDPAGYIEAIKQQNPVKEEEQGTQQQNPEEAEEQKEDDKQENPSHPTKVIKSMDRVCREYDFLGLLDRTGQVDSRLVDMFYSVPLVKLWEPILKEYVDDLREGERGKTHFWELNEFYKRVHWVPDNHPGITGKKDWPEDPRKKPENKGG